MSHFLLLTTLITLSSHPKSVLLAIKNEWFLFGASKSKYLLYPLWNTCNNENVLMSDEIGHSLFHVLYLQINHKWDLRNEHKKQLFRALECHPDFLIEKILLCHISQSIWSIIYLSYIKLLQNMNMHRSLWQCSDLKESICFLQVYCYYKLKHFLLMMHFNMAHFFLYIGNILV